MPKASAIIFSSFLMTLSLAHAKETTTEPAVTTDMKNSITLNDLRCERAQGLSLSDFKEKLFENCNLDKPYSASLSSILSENVFFYCCQKK